MRFSQLAISGLLMAGSSQAQDLGLQYPGPMYAGGIAYSGALDHLMVTGTIYGLDEVGGDLSSCFVSTLALDGGIKDSHEYGNPDTDESCSVIALGPSGITAYVGGGTQPGGPYTGEADLDPTVSQYGMILQLNARSEIRGYGFDDNAKVQYPVAIVADSDGQYIYVASMVSDNDRFTFLDDESHPDLTSGGQRKFGSDFYLVLEKFRAHVMAPGETVDENIIPDWYATFRFDDSSEELGGIQVSSMILAAGGTELVIVGSTRESGGPFGVNDGTDMDGFVIKIDPQSGDPLDDGRESIRVDDSEEADDWINFVCASETEDAIFVVGSTDEARDGFPPGSLHAFVAKLDLRGLTDSWTVHFKMESIDTPPIASALGCAVTPDGGHIYIVGDVGDKTQMADALEGFHGKTDVWIAKIDTSDGDMEWMRQVGSTENDRLARGNPITVDTQGNPIIFGDTYGDMYETHERAANSDGFVMSFDRLDGSYKQLLLQGGPPPTLPGEPPVLPVPDQPEPGFDLDIPDGPDIDVPVLDDTVATSNRAFGLQYPGPLYAGGVVVAPTLGHMMVTGSVYGLDDVPGDNSHCFVATIALNGGLLSSEEYGLPDTQEACSAIALSPDETQAYVAGGTQPGGFMTADADLDPDVAQYGMLLQVNSLSELRGYGFDDDATAQYPVAVVADPDGQYIYVASMASDNADPDFLDDEVAPDLTSGGHRQFGSDFHLVVEKYRALKPGPGEDVERNILPDWYATFRFDNTDEGLGGILVSSMVLAAGGTQLVVAGSTRESGGPYGENDGTDMDGWLIKMDPKTGDLYDSGDSARASIRVDDAEEADDWINAICADPTDPNSIYMVGATDEDIGGFPTGSLHAFIAKLELSSLTLQWRVHLPMKSESNTPPIGSAVGCVVTPDGTNVYVVGNTGHDTVMLNSEEGFANGKIDFFVSQLDPANGHVEWMRQVGTKEDDRLARGNPVASDADGNAIVVGDTYGSMFEFHDGSRMSDGFVMSFTKADGSHQEILNQDLAPPVGDFEPPVDQVDEDEVPVIVETPEEVTIVVPDNNVAPHEFVALGIQYTGPAYAGGVVYDSSLDRSIVTGSTYGMDAVPGDMSDCFVATVSMNNADILSRELYGTGITDEACSAIAFSPVEDTAYVVGGTETGGFLTGEAGLDEDTVQYGMILQVDDKSQLKGFGFDDGTKAQYPVAVVTDPNEDFIYVASMASNTADLNPPPGEVFPDWTSGGQKKYGSGFHLVVEKFLTLQVPGDEMVEKTIIPDWYASFEFEDNGFGLGGILVSSMVLAGGGSELVIVGSTRESGGPFGVNDGTDMDGWVIKLDARSGDLSESSSRSSIRVDDAEEADDWVNAVCVDRFDQDSIYIVGATDEDMPGAEPGATHAFVAKLDLKDLTLRWRSHLSMVSSLGLHPQATALGCAVAPDADGGKVYVVGNIRDGGRMTDAQEPSSHGKDDIFVAQFDAAHGQHQWTRQAGSAEDDRVAHGNPIALDADGNAIIFGETFGSMYHERDGAFGVSDVFLMTLSKIDGAYKNLLAQNGVEHHAPDALTNEEVDVVPVEDEEVQVDNLVALQTGPDAGPSYAGGMVYDKFSNGLYVTGATYGSFGGPDAEALADSSCFFGVLTLPNLQWKEINRYGHRNACSALSLTSVEGGDAAIVVGSTEEVGFEQNFNAKQVGFALDLANIEGNFEFPGYTVMDGSPVQFPVAVVTEDTQVWAVSMASDDTTVSADFEKVANTEYPNFTTGGVEKYGSRYTVAVERYTLSRSEGGKGETEETLSLDWRRNLNDFAVIETVFVSGMLQVGADLVVVGSMRGPSDRDMDGVMMKVSSSDGTFANDAPSVKVFESEGGHDDWIMNACADPNDEGYFYVVGATAGSHDESAPKDGDDVTVHAMMAKIDAATLATVWTKQYSVKHASGRTDKEAAAAALGCDVIPGEQLMYVAGVVENSATIEYRGEEHDSAGGDDVFVSLVSTEDGSTRWLRQVGSNGDDRIARGGGISVDENKNAVVYGDTNGSFFRDRSGDSNLNSDIFVMLFDFRDGTHMPPLEAQPLGSTSSNPPQEWFPNTMNLVKENRTLILAIVLSGLGGLALFCVCVAVCRRRRRERLEEQTTSIFTYLQQFDVDDVDLRKSPPGGWHGIYLNKLAYGINRGESYLEDGGQTESFRDERTPLAHSSVVTDALFMDAASSSSPGYLDDPSYTQPRTFDDEAGNMKPTDII